MIGTISWQRVSLWLAVLVGLTVLIWSMYSPILKLSITGWDSLNHIKSASERIPVYSRFFTEQLANGDAWYRPISALSYGMNYSLWGLAPIGYHVTDIFIHWVVALGVFALGYQGTGRLWAAGLGALLFALNPLLPPTVMNIAQRHDTLMTLGTVWTLALLHAAFHTGGPRRSLSLFGAWLAFVIAVGAKETGLFVLPLVLFMSWRYRHKLTGKYSILWTCAPFVLIALTYMGVRQRILQTPSSPFINNWNLELLLEFFQKSILPGLALNAWSLLTVILVLVSILLLCLPLLQNEEFQTWFVLYSMWIGIPLLLYFVVGIPQFANRYAYVLIPPIVLLLVRLLTVPLTLRPLTRQRTMQLGAKIVLWIVLLLWLPVFGVPFFPRGLMEREMGASSYLVELDRLVAELPAETTVDLEDVPSKFLRQDGVQMWFDLKWDTKQLHVGTVQATQSSRGRAILSMTLEGNRATISAKYLPFLVAGQAHKD